MNVLFFPSLFAATVILCKLFIRAGQNHTRGFNGECFGFGHVIFTPEQLDVKLKLTNTEKKESTRDY